MYKPSSPPPTLPISALPTIYCLRHLRLCSSPFPLAKNGQVATSGEESGASGSSGLSASELGATAVHTRAPQFERARSGPATLSHAVFEMLYVELRTVLGGLRRARTARALERAKSRAKALKAEREKAAAAAAEEQAAAASLESDDAGGKQSEEESVLAPAETTAEGDGEAAVTDAPAAVHQAAATDGTGNGDSESLSAQVSMDQDMRVKNEDIEDEKEKQKEQVVFEKLADMQDDLACLTLSRELQVLVSEVTMLLLCVSSTDSCRSLLSQPRWIAVLLGLLRLGPPYAQRRALRLLRRLLPHCEPESLAEIDTHPDGTDWSIVTIVKESRAGEAVWAGDDDGDSNSDDSANEAGGAAVTGRKLGRLGKGPPVVRVTSLSSSTHTDLIPARSLLCYFLDAIGSFYQTTPRPEWLGGDREGDSATAADERGGGGGTLRELRSWYRGQTPMVAGREQGRSAWSFSQLEGPLVCESVSLLRTLLQTSAWSGVTATLLQDAFQRGNACLRVLAREAAEKAEAASVAAASGASIPQSAAAGEGATGTGGGAESSPDHAPTTARNIGSPGSQSGADITAAAFTAGASVVPVPSDPPMAAPAAPEASTPAMAAGGAVKGSLRGATAPPSTTGTLLRTLGALSVLGGHVDMLYPGASAEIMPLDYGVYSRGGIRGARGSGVSAWGVRMGRSMFGLSGLERAAGGANGDGRGRGGGGGGFASYGGGSSSAGAGRSGSGRPCMVVSLSLAEGQAEVVIDGGAGAGGGAVGACGAGDARKPRVVPLDYLQAVPNVPVRAGALPPGLAQRVLETLTLWCLDRSLNAAFSEPGRSPANLSPPQSMSPPLPPGAVGQSSHATATEGAVGGEGLSDVLTPAVLDQQLLVGIIRFQAAKAAQSLLLHPPTASDFVKAASTPTPGRHSKGGAGAVLLEVAAGVSSSAGMGDLGAVEEFTSMLLSQWRFLMLDGNSKKVQEARYVRDLGSQIMWRTFLCFFVGVLPASSILALMFDEIFVL